MRFFNQEKLMKTSLVHPIAVVTLAFTALTPVLAADPAQERAELRAMCDQSLAAL